jgi:hypothetical protein
VSVQALSWVFDHSLTTGADRLVLLALANHAGEDPETGEWLSWPGVATIAREAQLADRTVPDVLTRLHNAGHIHRTLNAAPDSRMRRDRRTNLYHLVRPLGDPRPVPTCTACQERVAVTPHPVDIHNGGRSDDTPSPARAAATPQPVEPNGVRWDGATGCGGTAAKSLVEPSSDPVLRDARAARIADAGDNQDTSSPPATAADTRRATILAACRHVALRRWHNKRPADEPTEGWLSATTDGVYRARQGDGHRYLLQHPGITPMELADLLELNPHAAEAAATRRSIRDAIAGPGQRIRSREHALQLRQSLRTPTAPPENPP